MAWNDPIAKDVHPIHEELWEEYGGVERSRADLPMVNHESARASGG